MLLFETPFKIKLNFYVNNEVAITFLAYLFKYVENLNEMAKSVHQMDRDWASSKMNVSTTYYLSYIDEICGFSVRSAYLLFL